MALIKLFEELGGEVRLSSPIKSAKLVANGSQTIHELTDGSGISQEFDLVVSNADVHHTYDKIYSQHPIAKSGLKN